MTENTGELQGPEILEKFKEALYNFSFGTKKRKYFKKDKKLGEMEDDSSEDSEPEKPIIQGYLLFCKEKRTAYKNQKVKTLDYTELSKVIGA